jgi:hypothetical protein
MVLKLIVLKSLADIIRFEYMAGGGTRGERANKLCRADNVSEWVPKWPRLAKTQENKGKKPTPTHPNHHHPQTRPLYTRTENMLTTLLMKIPDKTASSLSFYLNIL